MVNKQIKTYRNRRDTLMKECQLLKEQTNRQMEFVLKSDPNYQSLASTLQEKELRLRDTEEFLQVLEVQSDESGKARQRTPRKSKAIDKAKVSD